MDQTSATHEGVPGPDQSHFDPSLNNSERPTKRRRILACQRCRRRKQKCNSNGHDPCLNCVTANEECSPTLPGLPRVRYRPDYVQSLEQRVRELDGESSTSLGQAIRPEAPLTGNVNNATSRPTIPQQQTSIAKTSNTTSRHGHGPARHSMNTRQARADANGRCDPSPSSCSNPSPLSSRNSLPQAQSYSNEATSSVYSPLDPLQCADLPDDLERFVSQSAIRADALPNKVEEHLIEVYFTHANRKYPFLLQGTFVLWYRNWKAQSPDESSSDFWQGFMVHMLFAVSLLLNPRVSLSVSRASQKAYDHAVEKYLPAVHRHGDRLVQIQAELLIALHALFSPSSEQVALTVSSAMRRCIVARLHLAEAEPRQTDSDAQFTIQLRRRVFWSAYVLDRLASGVLHLPFSIADDHITVPLFEDIDEAALLDGSFALNQPMTRTEVSSALHRTRLSQIQSEILSMTMRAGFDIETNPEWRLYILAKLEDWRQPLEQVSDSTNSVTDARWHILVYNHCLLYLHTPTKSNVRGDASEWSIRASIETIKIFRQFQARRVVPYPILGLVSQFSLGTTLLYCLWATPVKFRAAICTPKNIFEAVRLCSNTLAVMTERWEKTGVLAEVFELLTSEVIAAEYDHSPEQQLVRRFSTESVQAINLRFERLKSLVLNKAIIRMIEEMITDSWPTGEDAMLRQLGSVAPPSSTGIQPQNLQNTANIEPGAMNHETDALIQYAPDQFFDWIDSAYNLPDLGAEQVMGIPDALIGFEML